MENNKQAATRIIRSADEWRALLARFAASGMSPGAFCRVEKVSSSAFYKWRVRLNGVSAMPNKEIHRPANFVDLGALNTTQRSSARMELKIDLGDGIVLTLVRN